MIEQYYKLFFDNTSTGIAIFNNENPARYQYLNYTLARLIRGSVEDIIGKTLDEVLKDKLLIEENNQIIQTVIETKEERYIESSGFTLDGVKVYYQGQYFPIFDKNREITSVGILIHDISNLKKAENELSYQTKIYVTLLKILSDCINVQSDQFDNAVNRALENIGKFVNSDRAYIFSYDFENQIAINTFEWCNSGIKPQIDYLQKSPIDAFPEWVESHKMNMPVVLENVSDLPNSEMKTILGEQKIQSLISVPIFEKGNLIGFIGFDSVKQARVYTDQEIELIELFGIILINLKSRLEAEKKIQKLNEHLDLKVKKRTDQLEDLNERLINHEENQRKELAIDLHGGVTQTLGLAISKMKNIENSQSKISNEQISEIRLLLERSVREARSLMYELSPPILDDFEIDQALGVLIEDKNEIYRCALTYKNNLKFPIKLSRIKKLAIYRATSEILNNINKHSRAASAEIELSIQEGQFDLCVKDDGIGFEKANCIDPQKGFGLYSIIERFKHLGGNVEIESDTGKGTRIAICLPLDTNS